MHILFLILSILGAAAFWWYRLKYLSQAGSEAMDAIGRAQGKIRRNKIRKQTEESPVMAIDHPVVAAATLLTTVIVDPTLDPTQRKLVKREILKLCDEELAVEAMVYSDWVSSQALDPRKTTMALCIKLQEWLSVPEQNDVVDMIDRLDKSKHITLNYQMAELAKRKLSSSH